VIGGEGAAQGFELRAVAGSQLDPDIVEALLGVLARPGAALLA